MANAHNPAPPRAQPAPLRVGYVINEGKRRRFWQAFMDDDASAQHGVVFVDFSPTVAGASGLVAVDVIVQKAGTPEERAALAAACAASPDTPVVDPLGCTDVLADRHATWLLLQQACIDASEPRSRARPSESASADSVQLCVPLECVLHWPPWPQASRPAAATSPGAEGDVRLAVSYVEDVVSRHGLVYPLVLKPVAGSAHDDVCIAHNASAAATALTARPTGADGTAVAGVEGHAQGGRTLVAQQFVRHGGILHKVCVLGNAVVPVKRASVPDHGRIGPGTSPLVPLGRVSKAAPSAADAAAVHCPMAAATAAADLIRQRLGLTLFNFDFVAAAAVAVGAAEEPAGVCSSLPLYYILDVNYFPSFDGVPQAHDLLIQHLREQAAAAAARALE
jgi:hypothetical protein